MPDNFTTNPGVGGKTFASDEIVGGPTGGTADYALHKLAFGVLDSATLLSAADPLPAEPVAASPQSSTSTLSNIAPGSSADADSTQIGSSKTGKLMGVLVTGSVPFKVVVKEVVDAVETAKTTLGIPALNQRTWMPPNRDFITVAQSAGAGIDAFRATVSNLDTGSQAADAHVTWFWDEV